ncbi:MAG: prepilin-type N-terminal cleavage/methylation domain-containing protein [Mycobacteriales bacterium]
MVISIRRPLETEDEGFTLVELLVVVIIIGILAGIAIPVFLNQRKKGYDAEAKADLRNAASAQESWLSANSAYTLAAADLVTVGWRSSQNTTLSVISTRDGAGIVAIAPAVSSGSYCLKAQSKSGGAFYYDSAAGGLKTAACT